MRTVAVISQKGGAGKTTLALHIAVAAELAGYSTVLIDMDPQGTAEAWSEWRKEAPPTVVPAKTATLGRTLERAAGHGAEFAVIDTPPLAEAEARAAAKAVDLVLVTVPPQRLRSALDKDHNRPDPICGEARLRDFQRGPRCGRAAYAETTELVNEIGMKVAPIRISERAAFRHSTGSGQAAQETEPQGKAAAEVDALWRWICQQVDMPPRQRANTPAGVPA